MSVSSKNFVTLEAEVIKLHILHFISTSETVDNSVTYKTLRTKSFLQFDIG